MKLPVFTLGVWLPSEEVVTGFASSIGLVARGLDGDERIFTDGASRTLRVNARDGAIWFEDASRLWNPDRPPIEPAQAVTVTALGFFGGLKPTIQTKVADRWDVITRSDVCPGTHVSTYDLDTNDRTDKVTDWFFAHRVSLRVLDPRTSNGVEPTMVDAPLIGKSGRINITRDDETVIGASLVWRPLTGLWLDQELDAMLPPWPSDFIGPAVDCSSTLAYREFSIGPDHDGEVVLAPFWVTEFSVRQAGAPPSRLVSVTPAIRQFAQATTIQQQPQRRENQSMSSHASKPMLGTVWISVENTPASAAARDLETAFTVNGWHAAFSWGDVNAWSDDWRADDDQWIDAVDLVFYSGHADEGSWVLHDDDRLRYYDTRPPRDSRSDFWGKRLKWLIIDACGPLQDSFVSSQQVTDTLFGRWKGAFDGLQALLGAATVVNPDERVGKRFAELALKSSAVKAWLTANREYRGSGKPVVCENGKSATVVGVLVQRLGGDCTPFRECLSPPVRDPKKTVVPPGATRELIAIWIPLA